MITSYAHGVAYVTGSPVIDAYSTIYTVKEVGVPFYRVFFSLASIGLYIGYTYI